MVGELHVFIEHALPGRGIAALLGDVLGPFYARWCTGRMHADAARAFACAGTGSATSSEGTSSEGPNQAGHDSRGTDR